LAVALRTRVLVWGMGYVGAVTAACLADNGAYVIGIETNPEIARAFQAGRCPVFELQLGGLIEKNTASGRLLVTEDGIAYIADASVSFVCVGTPAAADGSCDFSAIDRVITTIGKGLSQIAHFHTVVIRSSIPPGSLRQRLVPLLEKYSGKRVGEGFGIAVNPEFLREGSAISDFRSPPYIIIGAEDDRSAAAVLGLYHGIITPIHRVEIEIAETLKLINNAFHSLKIAFANEVDRFCKPLGVNATALMQLVCADVKLNISPAYLRPGFAFGGSCLPKDLRSLIHTGQINGVSLPLLSAILPSNEAHLESARAKARQLGVTCLAVLGVAFKANTDDLRQSPSVELLRRLNQDGFQLWAFDPAIRLDTLSPANRSYLSERLPHYDTILRDSAQEALQNAEAILVCQNNPRLAEIAKNWKGNYPDILVLDLSQDNSQ